MDTPKRIYAVAVAMRFRIMSMAMKSAPRSGRCMCE